MSLNIELLERSFKQIEDRGVEFAAEFYANVFANYPELQPLFQNAHLAEQGKKLFDSLTLVVDNLRQPEVLSQALKGLGTRHLNYGVLPEHYPMIGNSLLMTFASFLNSDWTPEVQASWTEAYGVVTQLMLAGADYPPEILNCTQ